MPYGAFVELEEGVEGLVHVTEMSWTKRITKPGEVLNVGDEVDAVMLGIQKEDQAFHLVKAVGCKSWDMATHNYHQVLVCVAKSKSYIVWCFC